MSEALKRWDGEQWVTVAAVNRIEVKQSKDLMQITIEDYTQKNTSIASLVIPLINYTIGELT